MAGLDETWRGLSLTMPLKEVAFEVAADISPTALATGAINTLVRRETGEWDAHNTDVHGVVAALGGGPCGTRLRRPARQRCSARVPRPARRSPHWPSWVCATCGSRSALPCGRPPRGSPPTSACRSSRSRSSDWAERGGLVVSTLPAGAGAAAAAVLDGHRLDGHRLEGTLLDVVYADWPTPLAVAAAAAGLTVVPGLDMLVHQAAEQVRLMTGREAPLQAMLAAGRQAVSR